jgi:hypothetical protein
MNAHLRFALAVAVVAGGPLVVGCNGSIDSSGKDGGTDGAGAVRACPAAQQIDASALSGSAVAGCNAGFAHPNVCCRAAPTQVTSCVECSGAPFATCDTASLTFPDPSTCYSLEDGGCTEAPSLTTASSDAGAAQNCYYPCGPGGYSPEELVDAAVTPPACSVAGGGSAPGVACTLCCFGGVGQVEPSPACNTCPPTGCQCGSCPAGWQVPTAVQYDLCCRTNSSGVTECFSQASSIVGVVLI